MRIALVSHAWPPASIGGVEVATATLARWLSRSEQVSVLTREASPSSIAGRVRKDDSQGFRRWTVELPRDPGGFVRSFADPDAERAFGAFLAEDPPEWVIFAHLLGLSVDLPAMAQAAGARVAIALHDYWFLCPRGQLVDADGRRCPGPEPSACSACVAESLVPAESPVPASLLRAVRAVPGVARVAAAAWRRGATSLGAAGWGAHPDVTYRDRAFLRALSEADLLLAPSRHARARYSAWGVPAERIAVLPNPVDSGADDEPPPRVPSPRLRLGYFGQLLPTKGIEVLIEAYSRLPAGTASLSIHGPFVPYPADPGFEVRVRRRAARAGAALAGPYPPARAPALLATVDAIVVPSTWEENAPLVVGEARRSGAAVVATAIGGLPEIVRDGVDGLLVPPGDPGALATALARLAGEPGLAGRLGARGRPPEPAPLAAAALLALLRGVDTPDPHALASG